MEGNLNQLKIVIIGSGNVATHLAQVLSRTVCITQIYSRTLTNANALAQKIGKIFIQSYCNIFKTLRKIHEISV